ncbi:MAG: DMT family transporter [Planctomycetota bacterium]|jgi:drug/metabolite transporter (DMT)-like permease
MGNSFDAYIGPAAGVATSLLWTLTVVFFTAASRRIGPTLVNTTRLLVAIVLHGVTYRILSGQWLPEAQAGQVLYLAASGVIGLSIGDQALLTAFVDIGPRLTSVIMASTPLFAVFFGWAVLGETLDALAWLGVAFVVGGVSWVVLERSETDANKYTRHRVRGVILAFVYAACQAGGLLLSKQGIGHGWLAQTEHITPQAATLIRMVFAGLGMAPILAMYQARERRRHAAGLTPIRSGSVRAGLLFTAAGAIVGPYLGVWMSLVASDRAPLGIAQTLCSLVPIFILPLAVVLYKERVSPRAIIGAFLAVGGSALLFIWN